MEASLWSAAGRGSIEIENRGVEDSLFFSRSWCGMCYADQNIRKMAAMIMSSTVCQWLENNRCVDYCVCFVLSSAFVVY